MKFFLAFIVLRTITSISLRTHGAETCCDESQVENASWSVRAELVHPSGCKVCVISSGDVINAFKGKTVLFVGDSVTRYMYFSIVRKLCAQSPSEECNETPIEGFETFTRCASYSVKLGNQVELAYLSHHYGTPMQKYVRMARGKPTVIYYQSGLWMMPEKKNNSFVREEYASTIHAGIEALSEHGIDLLALGQTTLTRKGGLWGNLDQGAAYNAIMKEQLTHLVSEDHRKYFAQVPLGWSATGGAAHLRKDGVHPRQHAASVYAEVTLSVMSMALLSKMRQPIPNLAPVELVQVDEPLKEGKFDNYDDEWCARRSAHLGLILDSSARAKGFDGLEKELMAKREKQS